MCLFEFQFTKTQICTFKKAGKFMNKDRMQIFELTVYKYRKIDAFYKYHEFYL